jgi:hypothetical protein
MEEQDQLPCLDLADLPSADLVADAQAENFCPRTGADNRMRILAVHDDA